MEVYPIRCFTCGAPIGNKFEKFKRLVESGISPYSAFKELGITRYCCRRMIFTHVEYFDDIIKLDMLYMKKRQKW
ncbi:MAG: DNA-directed RNA polymerase subunit N [Candidatus Methanomethylicia archaeon]|nr:DNA-directed RNA polymerase subunit N [Candidatus Methanomethylicia archaeon]MCX8169079.1 DNA-directed RNA polymerase subunit N [Candidatus Methanomethylicia archaeon]MDW7988811.1 DNA-directed RNA polymerase subunit N [Nitrososphaerota archaeon]